MSHEPSSDTNKSELQRSIVSERLEQIVAAVDFAKEYSDDPAIVPLTRQVSNHLDHVRYSFRIAGDSEDYPYPVPRQQGYPELPTNRAIHKADRLLQLLDANTLTEVPITPPEELYAEAKSAEQADLNNLLENPLVVHQDFQARRAEEGDTAQFPELGATLTVLWCEMGRKPEVLHACESSPVLANLRALLMNEMHQKIQESDFGYARTLFMIEDAVAFFDIVARVNSPDPADSPEPYHSARFEYNWHSLSEDPAHTLLPTTASLQSADLLKIRGVSIGVIGISTDTIRVDGFKQTPYEFFHHDVDHTRRMHLETQAAIQREGVSEAYFSQEATNLINNVLLPVINIDGIDDETERDRRIAMRMILFEILHEDAYDPTRDSIADAILRAPMERAPFERETDDTTVEYFMGPRATTLAHVFRKLAHTFYDLPEQRSSSLGTDFARTRLAIARGAADLYRLVSDDPIEDAALLQTCMDLVSTDEGFTDAFIGNIAHDINRRAIGRSALKLMISRPLGVAAAVRKIGNHQKHIHSLFGYSVLEYEDPAKLEKTVKADLESYDPDEVIVTIGATPYGVGRLYPMVKDLGFMTLGVVASTAIGRNEECAEGVDEIVVVKDSGWGGYRYQQSAGGLLSPTTRVFVGASDSIAAYGGGEITAITLEEMRRRGKPVSFTPFEMNHRIATMLKVQRGDDQAIDFHGSAYQKWQTLQLNR